MDNNHHVYIVKCSHASACGHEYEILTRSMLEVDAIMRVKCPKCGWKMRVQDLGVVEGRWRTGVKVKVMAAGRGR